MNPLRNPLFAARFAALFAISAAILLATACSKSPAPSKLSDPSVSSQAAPPPTSAPPLRNILLISLDTLRADHLSQAGYPLQTSPFLDELATRGIRFSNAFVNTHGTTPSHTTMFTSLYQESHRVAYELVDGVTPLDPIPESIPQVQQLLSDAGYTTIGVTGGGRIGREFGFDRGFDVFDDSSRSAEDSRRLLLDSLATIDPERPVFAFFHTYEVHAPYRPPVEYEAFFGPAGKPASANAANFARLRRDPSDHISDDLLEYLRRQYDREIRYTDDVLRQLFTELKKSGFLDDALVIITSDHGDEFREHGSMGHGSSLYEELLHVPLLVLGPGSAPPRVESRLVSCVDITPTLLAFAGLPPGAEMEGRNLLEAPDDPPQWVMAQYSNRLYTARGTRWKLIENLRDHTVEFYDLTADPDEQQDLSPQHPQQVQELRSLLSAWRLSRPRLAPGGVQERDYDEAFLHRLRELGYLSDE